MKRIRIFLKYMGIAILSLAAWHCNTADEPPIKVLSPKAGDRFKAAETVKIVTRTDYSRVAGNLSAIYSADSGKKWELILSAAHHDGMALDTFPFPLKDFGFGAGTSPMLKIKEYGTQGKTADIGFIHVDP